MLNWNKHDELYMQSNVGALILFAIILKHLDKSPSASCPTQCQLLKELIIRWQNLSTIFQIFNTSNNFKPSNQYLCYDFTSIEDGNIAWIKIQI